MCTLKQPYEANAVAKYTDAVDVAKIHIRVGKQDETETAAFKLDVRVCYGKNCGDTFSTYYCYMFVHFIQK